MDVRCKPTCINIYTAGRCIKPGSKFLSFQTKCYQEQNTQNRNKTFPKWTKIDHIQFRQNIAYGLVNFFPPSFHVIVKWGIATLITSFSSLFYTSLIFGVLFCQNSDIVGTFFFGFHVRV